MIVDDKGIKDCWKEYMEKLMNEENEWYGLWWHMMTSSVVSTMLVGQFTPAPDKY